MKPNSAPFSASAPAACAAEHGEQQRIRLPLPIVEGSKDYRDKVALLQRMDEILNLSGMEADFVAEMVAGVEVAQIEEKGKPLSDRRRATVRNRFTKVSPPGTSAC